MPTQIRAVIITTSDACSVGEREDISGETLVQLLTELGAEIVANLRRKYGTDLATRFVVNKELLGGMRIRVGSDVWDSSVRNRLHRLQQQL